MVVSLWPRFLAHPVQISLHISPDNAHTASRHVHVRSVGNDTVPIQLTGTVLDCWFPGLAISNAKIAVYFSNEIYGGSFLRTTLGLKLAG